ncbi:MAG: hypothetical protein NWQ54_02110, partial [Paraglaciecola sp.]|nr:hypothetical protein [Paraglaciecola sp.]
MMDVCKKHVSQNAFAVSIVIFLERCGISSALIPQFDPAVPVYVLGLSSMCFAHRAFAVLTVIPRGVRMTFLSHIRESQLLFLLQP